MSPFYAIGITGYLHKCFTDERILQTQRMTAETTTVVKYTAQKLKGQVSCTVFPIKNLFSSKVVTLTITCMVCLGLCSAEEIQVHRGPI